MTRRSTLTQPPGPLAETPSEPITGDSALQMCAPQFLVGETVAGLDFFKGGQRLHHLFEARCDRFGFRESRKRVAVEYPDQHFSFRALDKLANQVARYLLTNGVQHGDRVALLFDRSIYSHAAVLAVSKVGGVYVPLDAAFPPDRIAYICQDSNVTLALTLSQYSHLFDEASVTTIGLDAQEGEIKRFSSRRLSPKQTDPADDRACYVIYTSGSTGRPKGVSVLHSNICSFLQAACASYGYEESDRFYQGMTMAFDYSVEELWVPLLSGATLVPAQSGVNLLGGDLAEFIETRRITAMCCVPTLLGTVEQDLPGLRLLMVSGEACPQDLADKWSQGRRFLNTYGPTEATVTATWTPLKPGQKVGIGGPLPGYSIVILSPDEERVLPLGEAGEIGIAGVGLAEGYVNLPEQTERAFVRDFVHLPNNPSGRIYRTGDLGLINEHQQVDYLGRIDAQVKIRGYRIELDEIAAVARTVNGVGQVAVNPVEADSNGVELVAYFTNHDPSDPADPDAIHAALKERLPPYMVPAFIEPIDHIPLLPSTKVDRKALPAPTGQRFMISGKGFTAPETPMQETLAEVMARLIKAERVSADAHFFDELGANSLIMARYMAAVRKQLGIKKVSMKLLYQHPTIVELAGALGDTTVAETDGEPSGADPAAAITPAVTLALHESGLTQGRSKGAVTGGITNADRDPLHQASDAAYLMCGIAQVAYGFIMAFLGGWAGLAALRWIIGAEGLEQALVRSALAGWGLFLATTLLMVAIKWIAIGRFKTGRIPLWSFHYFRFWVARTAVAANPLNLFAGTPIFNWYLRLMGARIGPRTVIFARSPVCSDLIDIGSDTIVRQDSYIRGYTARDGYIYCGPITIGSRSLVCEATVLEINSQIGDDSQLGTSSALLEGARIPNDRIYQGSPAEESTTRFDRVSGLRMPRWQPTIYSVLLALNALLLIPVPGFVVWLLWEAVILTYFPQTLVLYETVTWPQATLTIAAITAVGYVFGLLMQQIYIVIVPRIVNRFVRPNETHRLYGIQYFLMRLLAATSHAKTLSLIYGDSSLITHFLSAVGYDLSESTQTGSNFGVTQLHHSPFMIKFSRNTLVSDGLVMLNLETTSTSFRLNPVSIEADNYLGTDLHWPSGAKVGPDCLIGTKTMVPIDGKVRTGVGILGSPPFEIPRSVLVDRQFEHFKEPKALKRNLRNKLKSNLVTIGMYMTRIWSQIFLMALVTFALFGDVVALLPTSNVVPAAIFAALGSVTLMLVPAYIIAYERLVQWINPLRPLYCSLYDNRFWMHERFWKMNYNQILSAFGGTPLKAFYARLQGVKIGKQVFDDGASISEPMLTAIGDFCCLNAACVIQSHSMEDGTFKSDFSRMGAGCSIGVRGFLHYGTEVRDGALIQADAFVMKGSTIEAGDTWLGNPARDAQSDGYNPVQQDSSTYQHRPSMQSAA